MFSKGAEFFSFRFSLFLKKFSLIFELGGFHLRGDNLIFLGPAFSREPNRENNYEVYFFICILMEELLIGKR